MSNTLTMAQPKPMTEAPRKQRVFSGIQPTGRTHIGNYLGAMKNWVRDQHQYENFFCVVDLHAISQTSWIG